jgi:hypothetical protein
MTFFEIVTHKRPFSGLREGGDTMMNERCIAHALLCIPLFRADLTASCSSFWDDVSQSGDHNGSFNGCGPMCEPLKFRLDPPFFSSLCTLFPAISRYAQSVLNDIQSAESDCKSSSSKCKDMVRLSIPPLFHHLATKIGFINTYAVAGRFQRPHHALHPPQSR